MHSVLWFWLFIFAVFIALYVFCIRPILVNSVVLSSAFKEEASLFTQLRTKMAGWKTKIAARLVAIAGIAVGAYDQILPIATGQDWTPLTQKVPGWVLPVGLVFLGWLFSYLRKVTENPPVIITQKTDDGTVHVVAVNPPAPVEPIVVPAPPAAV